MKKVYVNFPESTVSPLYKLKLAETTKGSVLRGYVAREIVELADIDFFFIRYASENNVTFLDENKSLAEISEGKKIHLRLVKRYETVLIQMINETVIDALFDMRETVGYNIHKLNLEQAHKYVFSFLPKSGLLYRRVTVLTQPLVLQGWLGERLTLHKRICPSDLKNRSQENISEMYNYCRLSAKYGMTYFTVNNWGHIAILQYIAEGKSLSALNKSQISKLSELFGSSEDFLNGAKRAINLYSTLTPQKAAEEYIDFSLTRGAPCSYIDRVKFVHVGRKWRMPSSRYMFVALNFICLTKDLGEKITHNDRVMNIKDISCEGEFVSINFMDDKSWRIKCDRPTLLAGVLEDVKALSTAENEEVLASMAPTPPISLGAMISNSSMTFDIPIEVEEAPSMFSALRKLNVTSIKASPGISLLVLPEADEENRPYSMEKYLWRDMKVTKRLTFPGIIVDEKKDIDVPEILPLDKFISLRYRSAQLILLAVLAIMIIAIVFIYEL